MRPSTCVGSPFKRADFWGAGQAGRLDEASGCVGRGRVWLDGSPRALAGLAGDFNTDMRLYLPRRPHGGVLTGELCGA